MRTPFDQLLQHAMKNNKPCISAVASLFLNATRFYQKLIITFPFIRCVSVQFSPVHDMVVKNTGNRIEWVWS